MTATAPAYKSAASADSGTGTGTAFSLTLPGGLANGDTAYMAVVLNTQNDRGDPSGWTLLDFGVSSNLLQLKVYRKTLTAAESGTAVTFTLSNAQKWAATLVVVAGDAGVDTDTEAWETSTNGTAWTAGAVTPTLSSGLNICFHGFRRAASGTITQTAPTGWTERGEASVNASASPTVAVGSQTEAATAAGVSSGADTDGGVNNTATNQLSYVLTVKPAAEELGGTISASGSSSVSVPGAKGGQGTITASGSAACTVDGEGDESGSEDHEGTISASGSASCAVAGRKNGHSTAAATGTPSCTLAGRKGGHGVLAASGTALCTIPGGKGGYGVLSTAGAASCTVDGEGSGVEPVEVPVAVYARPGAAAAGHHRPAPAAEVGSRPATTAPTVYAR